MHARCWKLWNYLSGKRTSARSLPTIATVLHRVDRKALPGPPSCVASQHFASLEIILHMNRITKHRKHLCHPGFHAVGDLRGLAVWLLSICDLQWWDKNVGSSHEVRVTSPSSLRHFVIVSGDLEVQMFSCEFCFPYPQAKKKLARWILFSMWIIVYDFINCLFMLFLVMPQLLVVVKF